MSVTQKKTPAQKIAASVRAILTYQNTIKVGSEILKLDAVKKDDSTRVAQESLVRGATESMESEYNGIFRRVTEHADGMIRDANGVVDTATLEKFATHVMAFRK